MGCGLNLSSLPPLCPCLLVPRVIGARLGQHINGRTELPTLTPTTTPLVRLILAPKAGTKEAFRFCQTPAMGITWWRGGFPPESVTFCRWAPLCYSTSLSNPAAPHLFYIGVALRRVLGSLSVREGKVFARFQLPAPFFPRCSFSPLVSFGSMSV